MPYTPAGPFTPGGAPGISAAALNGFDNALAGLNSAASDGSISSVAGVLTALGLIANGGIQGNPTPVVVNGTTNGTATLYQVLTGTVKVCFLSFSNYQNSTATQQTISFPSPFAGSAFIFTGGTPVLEPFRSGSLLGNSTRVLSSIAVGGGVSIVQNFIANWSIGYFTANPDAIGLGVSQSATFGGFALIIGN